MKVNLLMRRLLPLYISSFFQGMMFWYAIEKVFMTHIGFKPSTIVIAVIASALTALLLQVPSGIVADRWSRKGMLVLGCLALTFASLLLGLSNTVADYILATCLYGAYDALHSGTFDAMIYDTLLEEQGSRTGYEKYLGKVGLYESYGLVISSLLGGVIANSLGLRYAFYLSVPSGVLAIVAALLFKEPQLHKTRQVKHVWGHTRSMINLIFKNGYLIWILVALLATSVMAEFFMEVDQLWPLALKLHLVWYGPLNALLLLGYGIGGVLAAKILKSRAFGVFVCIAAIFCVSLLATKNMIVIAAAQFGTLTLFVALYTLMLGRLHDVLPSNLRSGSSSISGMLSGIVFIPLVFLFGKVAGSYSVFRTVYMLVPIALIAITSVIIVMMRSGKYRSDGRQALEKPDFVGSPIAQP